MFLRGEIMRLLIIGIILGSWFGIFFMCLLSATKKNCLHCGKHFADYCEKCYQDLISENMELRIHKVECYENHIPRID